MLGIQVFFGRGRMATIECQQGLEFVEGEERVVVFRIVDEVGGVVVLTGCTFALRVVAKVDGAERFTKADVDFDKTGVANGIVKATFLVADLSVPGIYEGQLKIVFVGGTVDKNCRFDVLVEPAIVS
jgi:hypothetical protein